VKEPTIDRDEQILSNELPDAALEIAAAKYGEAGNPFTIAFFARAWTPALHENLRGRSVGPARIFTTAHDCRPRYRSPVLPCSAERASLSHLRSFWFLRLKISGSSAIFSARHQVDDSLP
jgi:hypothetical protein